MRVVIAGSSGLIGTALVAHLRAAGTRCCAWSGGHPPDRTSAAGTRRPGRIDAGTFDGVDAVVNLGGVGIARPAVERGPQARLSATAATCPPRCWPAAVAEHGVPAFLSRLGGRATTATPAAAAIDEDAPVGRRVPRRDLRATGRRPPSRPATRGARVRDPAHRAGARPGAVGCSDRLRPLFKFALGGRIGPGTQYMPWISLDDEVGAHPVPRWSTPAVAGRSTSPGRRPSRTPSSPRRWRRRVHRPTSCAVPAPSLIKTVLGRDGRGDAALRAARACRRSWRRPATSSGTAPSATRSRRPSTAEPASAPRTPSGADAPSERVRGHTTVCVS